MYRWLADPNFRAAYRAALRSAFDEALGILERGAGLAAQALLDEVEDGEDIDSKRSPSIINASMAVLDCAFHAQDAITVKEELADLRAELASLKANQQQPGRKVAESLSSAPKAPSAPCTSHGIRMTGRTLQARLHPEVRHGAWRRRWCEWEQPHFPSWRFAFADDAEWMSGKSRDRLDRGVLMDVGPRRSNKRNH